MTTNLKEYYIAELFKGNARHFPIKMLKIFFGGNGSQMVIFWYRLSRYLHEKKYKYLSLYILRHLEKKYGVYIGVNASIGIGLKLPHPTGIVIGDGVVIGNACTIFQQVTFGGAHLGDVETKAYPRVGDNTVFFAGAKIIGQITIGSNAVIGANSVVNKDVPEGSTVAGIPARILGEQKSDGT